MTQLKNKIAYFPVLEFILLMLLLVLMLTSDRLGARA